MDLNELLSIFDTELKRGTLTLVIMSQLQTPQYGYSLIQNLTDLNIEVEAGTLYPMLRRLQKQGVLKSDWDTNESRPRKYYQLSDLGLKLFFRLKENWKNLSKQMNHILWEENV